MNILELLEFSDKLTIEDTLQKLAKITSKSQNAIQSLMPKNRPNYERKQENTPEENQDDQNEFLVRFQNLNAVMAKDYYFDAQKLTENITLNNLFLICKNLLPELGKYENYQEYLQSEIEILKLISQNLTTKKSILIAGLRQNINSLVQAILFDSELMQAYQEVQQNLGNL